MNIFIDTETIPCQWPGIQDEFLAEVTAPGQYKKPESIAEWMAVNGKAQAEENWLKTSFDGGLGQICVIGWAIDDEPAQSLQVADMGAEAEQFVLASFLGALNDMHKGTSGLRPVIIGHNHIAFDLPFIWKRAMVHNLRPPLWFPRNPKPWAESVADTMLLWDGTQRAGGSMAKICRSLGIPGKGDMDGSKVWPMVRDGRIDDVASYCRDDVDRTRQMYKRMMFES